MFRPKKSLEVLEEILHNGIMHRFLMIFAAVFLFDALIVSAGKVDADTAGADTAGTDTTGADAVESVLNHKYLSKNGSGFYAVWADSGEPLAAFQETKPLTPASSAKLIPTYCALKTLGQDHRFKTEFRATSPIRKGNIQDLVVVGGADPSLVSETLWAAIRHLKAKGLKNISGDIYMDDTLFASENFPGQIENSSRAYNAPTSALSLNYNAVAIEIIPDGEERVVSLFPDIPYLEVVNRLKHSGRKNAIQASLKETPDREIITLTGTHPKNADSKVMYRSISRPTHYFAGQLVDLLSEMEIAFQGKVLLSPKKADTLLWTLESKPLSLIIRDINKFSNNFMTEQLTKYLGATQVGGPGTTQKGMQAVAQCLQNNGVATETIRLENGSGLSNGSKITAKDLVTVLLAGYRDFGIRSDYLASLSLHGIDGTMRDRPNHRGLKGILRAKTGSLSNVSALAGFVPADSGKVIAFAILLNDFKGPLYEVQKLQDQLVFQWKTGL